MLVDSSFMKEPFIQVLFFYFLNFICSPSASLSPIIQNIGGRHLRIVENQINLKQPPPSPKEKISGPPWVHVALLIG